MRGAGERAARSRRGVHHGRLDDGRGTAGACRGSRRGRSRARTPRPRPRQRRSPSPPPRPPTRRRPQAASLGSTARATASAAPAATSSVSAAPPAQSASPVLEQTAAPTVAVPLKPWRPRDEDRADDDAGSGRQRTPTIWLNRMLPDPTPPAKRLTPAFASRLVADAKEAGVDWSLMLGVLRATVRPGPCRRGTASSSASARASRRWGRSATTGRPRSRSTDTRSSPTRWRRSPATTAPSASAPSSRGSSRRSRNSRRRSSTIPRSSIYAGGRDDLANGRVDVRVIALIAYLRETFGEVTVSCLVSGHGLYARPGVISAHVYGQAIDIAALGTTSILGHQQPGGVTEHAVRDILLLPSELQPQQVISLLASAGPRSRWPTTTITSTWGISHEEQQNMRSARRRRPGRRPPHARPGSAARLLGDRGGRRLRVLRQALDAGLGRRRRPRSAQDLPNTSAALASAKQYSGDTGGKNAQANVPG